MFTNELDKIIKDYMATLQKGIEVFERNGRSIISLPFESWSGDFLEISVKRLGSEYVVLSDMSHEIGELWSNGMNLGRKHRRIIKDITNQYNVQVVDDEITAQVPFNEVGRFMHAMIQALLRIGDLTILHQLKPLRKTPLAAEVDGIIRETKLDYSRGIQAILPGKIIGTKGHQFDFVVFNGRKIAVKTLDQKLQETLTTKVKASAFEFYDVRLEDNSLVGLSIYDENNDLWSDDHFNILREFGKVIPKQEKEEVKAFLLHGQL